MKTTTIVSYKFNVNGECSDVLHAKRGIRQGNPISPMLFVIMVEYMNRLMVKMPQNSNFNHYSKCEKLALTHMAFADDVLLFCRGDLMSFELILEAFKKFSDSTCLIVNPRKCKLFCGGMETSLIQEVERLSGFEEGQLPVRCLGVPLLSKKLSVNHYLPSVDRIFCRIRHWSAKLLSTASRIQLVKSITMAIAQYWITYFPIPMLVIQKIEAICRSFIWTGKAEISRRIPMAWSKVCSLISQGGLNIINIGIWNKVSMLKCLCNICMKVDNHWVKWVHTYYLKDEDVKNADLKNTSSWILKVVMLSRGTVNQIQDLWVTMLTNCKFSMRKTYMELIRNQSPTDLFQVIRNNYARPHADLTCWLACHGLLAMKEKNDEIGFVAR
ncbi:unnamed protein product [Lathyrus sativus]|nr:unnamed protein product [Lathyrus sativus]